MFERLIPILKGFGNLKETRRTKFDLFFLLSYESRAHGLKVEIGGRQFGSRYEIRTYPGVSTLVRVPEDMFAHKLMTMYERIGRTSRDIYDVWFFLQNRFPINKEIVEQRPGVEFGALLEKCIDQLERMSSRHILDGVGDLLTPGQKDWARARLREDTIALLKLRLQPER